MVSDEKNLPESFVPGEKDSAKGEIILSTAKNVKWGMRTGSLTYPSPTVVGGKIFIGTREPGRGVLKCLDVQSGRLLWQYSAPYRQFPGEIQKGWKYMLGRITPMLGICATAAADADGVYLVNHRCEVICLEPNGGDDLVAPGSELLALGAGAAGEGQGPTAKSQEPKAKSQPAIPPLPPCVRNGRVKWTFDMWDYGIRPADGCNGSPLIDGDLLYVNTSNGTDRDADIAYADSRPTPAPAAANLIVLHRKTGRLLARDDEPRIGPNILHGQWSTPSLGVVRGRKLLIYAGGDGVCYAFEAFTPSRGGEGEGGGQPAKLKTVWSFDCVPPEYKQFGGLDWATHYSLGDKRLKQSLNKKNESSFVGMCEFIACPVLYKDRVYIAIGRDPEHGRGRGALWCIDATKAGDIPQSGKIWGYQGLDRSMSTVSISGGLLYVADIAGRLHCLDAETGAVQWVHETNVTIWSSTLVADGKIYLPTTKHLWVLAEGKEKKVLSQISLGAPIYATPVAVDGTLYVSSSSYLWAVKN